MLVDCDLRRRGATKLVGESDVGIVEVVEEKFPVQRALIRDTKSNAWILPASSQRDIPHDLFSKPEADQVRLIASHGGRYVALTHDDGRFARLIDRGALLERVTVAVTR